MHCQEEEAMQLFTAVYESWTFLQGSGMPKLSVGYIADLLRPHCGFIAASLRPHLLLIYCLFAAYLLFICCLFIADLLRPHCGFIAASLRLHCGLIAASLFPLFVDGGVIPSKVYL